MKGFIDCPEIVFLGFAEKEVILQSPVSTFSCLSSYNENRRIGRFFTEPVRRDGELFRKSFSKHGRPFPVLFPFLGKVFPVEDLKVCVQADSGRLKGVREIDYIRGVDIA